MKNLLLLFSLLFVGISVNAQDERVWENLDNPNAYIYMNSTVIYNGVTYQAVCSTSVVKLYRYNTETSDWSFITQLTTGTSYLGMESRIIGDKLYFVLQSYSSYELLSYDFSAQQLVNMNASVAAGSPSHFKVLSGSSLDDLHMLYVSNLTELWVAKYNSGSNNWSTYNYTSLVNTSGVSLNSGSIDFYKSSTDLYASVSGSANAVVRATLANPGVPSYYNSAGSNDGKILYNGSFDPNDYIYFTGNTQNAPTVNYMHAADGKIYQAAITTGNLNISSTLTPLFFSASLGTVQTLNKVPFSFMFAKIGATGSISPNAPLYMIGQDHSSGIIDTIGGVIDITATSMGSYFHMNLENQQQQHLVVSYKLTGSNGYSTKILNRKPFKGTNAQTINTGLCLGHQNEIYPQFEIYDADVEKVRIVSVTSLNGHYVNLSAIPYSYNSSQNPAVSKFRIYGKPMSPASDKIIVTYTDGYSVVVDTLDAISVTTNAPNVYFIDSPLRLCSNDNLIELETKVNIAGQGVFLINGQPLASSTVNGITQSQLTPNGTLNYRVNVDGCFVEAGVSFSFVNAGIASATTTPASCGATDGSATVSFTNGTSSNVTLEWSTGETTPTISNLSPGAYYYQATDEYGCNSTGFASVAANGITITETINNLTCAGADNGSVSIVAGGVPSYTVLWSTGHSTNGINNLKPGNYEVTVRSGDCQVTKSYIVTSPSPITAELVPTLPDCAATNGSVNATVTGGTGALSFNWIGQSQSTEDLVNKGFGYYELKVTDASGCTDTFGIQLNDLYAPIISDSVINANCNVSSGAILMNLSAAPGGNPAYQFNWSNGTITQNNFNLPAGAYTITANASSPNFANICYSRKTIIVGTKAPLRQEICMVTVDLATTTNLVVWERVEENVAYYNIYRENAVAGNYMWIDSVSSNDESVFNDVVASPDDRSWRYKIAAVNYCGTEGPASIAHKTVHLNTIIDANNGSKNIYWDDYEGLVGTVYKVWRMSDQTPTWTALTPTVAFGTSFFNDVPPPNSTGLDYYVEMIPPYSCTAEKAQDFNSSRSNKDKAQFNPGQGTGDSNNSVDESYMQQITVYPNPVSERLLISQQSGEILTVEVLGLNGSVLTHSISNQLTQEIDMSALAGGIYFVKLKAGSVERTVKVIKQ